MLRLLRTILPSWEGGANTKHQLKVVEDLFSLLGQVLVLCSSPFVLHSTRSGESICLSDCLSVGLSVCLLVCLFSLLVNDVK